MKPRLAAIGTSVLLLTTCSVPAIGSYPMVKPEPNTVSHPMPSFFDTLEEFEKQRLINEAIEAREMQITYHTINLKYAIDKALDRVGKTPYVFSGSTPQGWDCSGLVMWVYSHLGMSLEHSATKQMRDGYIVKEPKFGDLVVFKRNGSKQAYHVGIYIEDGKMLHAGGRKGDRTELIFISSFADKNSKVIYSRLVKTH